MVDRFREAAEAVGSVVTTHTTVESAVDHLSKLANGASVSRSILGRTVDRLISSRSDLVPGEPPDAYLCLSHAAAGIAETGSLLLDLGDTAGRAATALARRHAVLINRNDIVADLAAAAPLIADALASGTAYLSITTGPSRTADIERVLTIGVHGAKELHILILEEGA